MAACYRSFKIDHYFLVDFESKIVKGTATCIVGKNEVDRLFVHLQRVIWKREVGE